MADESNIILGEETVTLVGTGESPVVDIEGGNNWNLSESVGDVRIGDDDNMLKMGVALDGGGAGNGRIQATSDLRLGSRDESIISIDDGGIRPHNGSYSLGTNENRWDSLWLDGDISVTGGELSLDTGSTLTVEGDVLFTGQIGLDTEILGNLVPAGPFDVGERNQRWDTLYVNSVDKASDRRLKTDIEELNDGLETLLDFRPVSYSLKSNGDDTHLGLIGQEVADTLPEIVNRPGDDDGYLGVDYTELVAVLVDAVQTQQEQKEELEDRVDRQQAEIESQRERIDDIEERLATLEQTA